MSEATTTEPAPTEPAKPEPPALADPLGDAGKRALEEERAARKAAEKTARDAQAKLDKLQADSMSEQEKAVAKARAEGKAEAFKDATTRLVRAEVRALAAGKLADPSDAIGLLDLDSFVDERGEVDTKAITSAIDGLVKDKPYLSARPGNGSGEGGPRGAAPTASAGNDPLLAAVQQAVG